MMNRVHQHGAHEEQLTFLYTLVSHRSDTFAVRNYNTLTPVTHICFSAAFLQPSSGVTTMVTDGGPPVLKW